MRPPTDKMMLPTDILWRVSYTPSEPGAGDVPKLMALRTMDEFRPRP
jgi:hypothetical protein